MLADHDGDYIDSLSNYLMKHHAQSFDIHTFDCVESLTAFFSDDKRRVNVLLAGPEFINFGIPSGSAEVVILLDDGNADQKRTSIPFIDKYQHAEKLVSKIFSLYSGQSTEGRLPAGKNNTRITAFISPAGGAGKSVISAGCSILCSKRGLKVFYLNLEGTPTTGLYFKGTSEQNFSNVLFYLKDKAAGPDMKLAGARCKDVSTGVHFFLPPESQLEMSCLQPGDVKRLLDSFRSSALYDAVFIDMPGVIDECSITAMNAADHIVCICSPDSTSKFKCQSFQAGLELLEQRYITGLTGKMICVMNDSRGIGFDNSFNPAGNKLAVMFEESKALSRATGGSDLLNCGSNFAFSINMLLEKINPAWAAGKCAEAGGKTFET